MIQELKLFRKNNNTRTLEEQQFIANCLKVGLSIEDLKNLEYKDVLKILICYNRKENDRRIATTSDWDKLCGG